MSELEATKLTMKAMTRRMRTKQVVKTIEAVKKMMVKIVEAPKKAKVKGRVETKVMSMRKAKTKKVIAREEAIIKREIATKFISKILEDQDLKNLAKIVKTVMKAKKARVALI